MDRPIRRSTRSRLACRHSLFCVIIKMDLFSVIDDLEHERRPQAAEVFARYRMALDDAAPVAAASSQRSCRPFSRKHARACTDFAHAQSVNYVAQRTILPGDHEDDVETIPRPKARMKAIWKGFDEVKHGRRNRRGTGPQSCITHPKSLLLAPFHGRLVRWSPARMRCDLGRTASPVISIARWLPCSDY